MGCGNISLRRVIRFICWIWVAISVKVTPGDANVFNIQVGVSINLFVKKRQHQSRPAYIFYNSETAEMPKETTFGFLDACEHIGNVNWDSIQSDARHTWLTEGLREDFETFMPIGSKASKSSER